MKKIVCVENSPFPHFYKPVINNLFNHDKTISFSGFNVFQQNTQVILLLLLNIYIRY
jgi:hypothetical protein